MLSCDAFIVRIIWSLVAAFLACQCEKGFAQEEQGVPREIVACKEKQKLDLKLNSSWGRDSSEVSFLVAFDRDNSSRKCDLFIDLVDLPQAAAKKIRVSVHSRDTSEESGSAAVSRVIPSECNENCEGNLRFCILDLRVKTRYQVKLHILDKTLADDVLPVKVWGKFLQGPRHDDKKTSDDLLGSNNGLPPRL